MSQTEVQLIKNGAVVDADINGMSSSKLSGALPAISGASLTNLPAGAGKAKNLIINGAMQVVQRGTSTTDQGYLIDRFDTIFSGTDEAPTIAQVDVAAGTTPYTLGFRKALKITNGNQTSGAGSSDYMNIRTILEAQDVVQSGWNVTSSSSNITLSFWVKSSVAQNFYGYIRTMDGTNRTIAMETGSLSADTWTKVTKTIPGDSNITINNDNGAGLQINFGPFWGTDRSDNTVSLTAWRNYGSGFRTKDATTTWYTTNDATFEITGVQLEVGDSATDFEHRPFGEELALCQRYYYTTRGGNNGNPNSDFAGFFGIPLANGQGGYGIANFPVAMRATPTIVIYDATATSGKFTQNGINYFTGSASNINTNGFSLISGASGVSTGTNYTLTAGFTASAEL